DMTLEGICHKQGGQERLPAGMAFAASRGGLCASPGTRQTWVGLARGLWPARSEALPVSTQTAWLFRLLPAPRPTVIEGEDLPTLPPRITAAAELQGSASISQP
ncbi:MAG: hypothetical protein ACO1RT_05290, partial [Planctomycetaceae bacterium]